MILAREDCSCPLVDEGISLVNSPICRGVLLFMTLLEGYLKGRCRIAAPCDRVESIEDTEAEYDFIVVGSGPAGSIVASRLSENEKFNVLLLEAGGQEPIGARVPSFYRAFWSNNEVDWSYRTVPENYCLDQDGKGCLWSRGKVLGGSNLLNGLMYHRGHAADYAQWVEKGAEGWSWEENFPYFDRTEGNRQIGSLVSEKYHSGSGPLPVQQYRYQPSFLHEILNAINDTGLPVVADMNDPTTPEGFSIAQTMNADGQRYTAARAFLKPKSERPNLSVKMHAHVTKVLLNGTRAVGVEYLDKQEHKKTVKATKEVILSAGALNSPHILLHSGIGPKETLGRFNIPLVADLPVGKNLVNHVGVCLYFIVTELSNTHLLDWNVLTEYLLTQEGPMSSNAITQLSGLLYSSLADKSKKQPDLQFFFDGLYAECSKTGVIGEAADDCPQNGRNISATAVSLLPRSVGYLTLNSTDPLDPPLFYPEYFKHPDDMLMVKDGIKYLRRIFESDTMKKKFGVKLNPEQNRRCNSSTDWSDEWMECVIRAHTDPQNHQQGTTAIGIVVDPQLRVYNIDGLRVIDASAMPTQPTGNPQAAIMMVAERGAELIKNAWA